MKVFRKSAKITTICVKFCHVNDVLLYKRHILQNGFHLYKMCFKSPPVSQGNDTDITGAEEKAESSRYSRSYTSGATLGAELRRGRSRRLSSSLQVLNEGAWLIN